MDDAAGSIWLTVPAGNLSAPTELVNGCPYSFYLPDRAELYMSLKRPSATHSLSMEYAFKGEYKPPTAVFSWDGQCCTARPRATIRPYAFRILTCDNVTPPVTRLPNLCAFIHVRCSILLDLI